MRITKRNISRICHKYLCETYQNSVSIDNKINTPSDINSAVKQAQGSSADGTNVTFQASRADNNKSNDRTIVYNSQRTDNIAQSVQKDLTDHKINANDTIVVTDGNNNNVYSENKLLRKWKSRLNESDDDWELPFEVNDDGYVLVSCGHGYCKKHISELTPQEKEKCGIKDNVDKYEGLSDEELKDIADDMEADYWIDYYKSNPYED